MRITAKVDYGVRAAVELAAAPALPVKSDEIADRQAIPGKFLENILADLRRAGLVVSQRGSDGGYRLAVPAEKIAVADIIRAVEGPLAEVHGSSPDQLHYEGAAAGLGPVWVATRAALRAVLEQVTVADIVAGHLPDDVEQFIERPDAWAPRPTRPSSRRPAPS